MPGTDGSEPSAYFTPRFVHGDPGSLEKISYRRLRDKEIFYKEFS
jgi:hypothetical protein